MALMWPFFILERFTFATPTFFGQLVQTHFPVGHDPIKTQYNVYHAGTSQGFVRLRLELDAVAEYSYKAQKISCAILKAKVAENIAHTSTNYRPSPIQEGRCGYLLQQPLSGWHLGLQSQPLGVNWAAGKGMRLNSSQGSSAQPGESQHSLVGML